MDVSQAIKVARMTDVGQLREHNEDAVASDLSIGLVILTDGMGGYKAGEVASDVAILEVTAGLAESMSEESSDKQRCKLLSEAEMLSEAVSIANDTIYKMSQQYRQCEGMGTTLVVGVFANNKIVVGHIGDSRMYRLRGDVLMQLTEDHSLLQEQLNAGLITDEEARTSANRNLVTRALGTDQYVELELNEYDTKIDDIYMLCSDGLTDLVDDDVVRTALIDADDNVEQAAISLVRLANEAGGNDNISVVVAQVRKDFSLKRRWVKKLLSKSNT